MPRTIGGNHECLVLLHQYRESSIRPRVRVITSVRNSSKTKGAAIALWEIRFQGKHIRSDNIGNISAIRHVSSNETGANIMTTGT